MSLAHRAALGLSAMLALSACGSVPGPRATSAVPTLRAQAATKAPSRLRRADGTAKVATFGTYYAVPDTATLDRLAQRDISFVQPNITPDQMNALQNTGYAAVYLAIGELGTSNTYYENGVAKSGQEIFDAHKNDSPKWFLGENNNFNAKILNLTNPAVRTFVLEQADILLDRGFDGLFMDTADDAEFFHNADSKVSTDTDYLEGETLPNGKRQLVLFGGRPDYPTMRRSYIDTIKALRSALGSALLVQNGGFDLLLDRQNGGDGTQGYVDGVMHEVAATKNITPPTTDPNYAGNAYSFMPQYYETWEQNYARNTPQQAALDRDYRANRDALALEYFRAGGVVFQQDFGHPDNYTVQCASYAFAKNIRTQENRDGWLPAYSDGGFQRLYDYVDTSATVRAAPGCSTYDKVTDPDFAATFKPSSVNVGVGRTATTTITVGSVNGYTGKVYLSLGDLPAGITATLSQTAVTPGPGTQVTVTMTVPASAAANTYIVPIRAQSQRESMRYDLRLKAWKTTGDSVFVAHSGLGTVMEYDNSASLTASSVVSRSLPNYALTQANGIALDADGTQYVVNSETVDPATKAKTPGRLTVYPSFSLNSSAATTVSASLNYPTAVAVDAQKRVWVVQSGVHTVDGSNIYTGTPRVSRFDPGSGTEAVGFDVPKTLSVGTPSQVAVQGQTLWVSTAWGNLLRYDVSATPRLTGMYNLPASMTGIGGMTVTADGALWLAGTWGYEDPVGSGKYPIKNNLAARINLAALPASNGSYAVDAQSAVTKTVTAGLYDPAGIALDSAGNLWVVNKTGAAGLNTENATPGSLIRFPAASLTTSSPAPNLSIGLGSRYPVGLAVGKP